jgi:hypothetical protein
MKIDYDKNIDSLFLFFHDSKQPTVNYVLGRNISALVSPVTEHLYGIEIDHFASEVMTFHPSEFVPQEARSIFNKVLNKWLAPDSSDVPADEWDSEWQDFIKKLYTEGYEISRRDTNKLRTDGEEKDDHIATPSADIELAQGRWTDIPKTIRSYGHRRRNQP